MEEVRNCSDKLVCRIDRSSRTVEIVIKGCITTIQFKDDGTVEIQNAKAA